MSVYFLYQTMFMQEKEKIHIQFATLYIYITHITYIEFHFCNGSRFLYICTVEKNVLKNKLQNINGGYH